MSKMSDFDEIYAVKANCPACGLRFEFSKLRTKAVRYMGQDTDLCPKYQGENPLFYDALVCPACGFAQIGTVIGEIDDLQLKAVRERVTPKWIRRDFGGHRNVEQAIEAYKIVLLNYQARKAVASEMAKSCMRLAWMYRIRGDSVLEYKFLGFALKYYLEVFSKEKLPAGKLDEFTLFYLLGEIARRLGKWQESFTWFGKLLSSGMEAANKDKLPKNLLEMARDQIQQTKDDMKNEGVANKGGFKNGGESP